jgi:carbamoyltransferase
MSQNTYVLGVSMSSHDRSAALMRNGQIVAAIAEERLDRRKKSQGFYGHASRAIVPPPSAAIAYVLREVGIGLDRVDLVVCGRSITTCRDTFLRYVPVNPAVVVEPEPPAHHLAHAYSAYACAPFASCAVLVIDEQGHRLTDGSYERCTWLSGSAGPLSVARRFLGRDGSLSLGMYFDAFAALTGLSEAGLPASGKLMALAGYGDRRPGWPSLVSLMPDGDVGIRLADMDSFLEAAGLPVQPGYEGWHPTAFDGLRLKFRPVHWSTSLAADLARHAQDDLEQAVLHSAAALRAHTGEDMLTYAGGVALNCTANARLREAGYRDVFIQPAATDDGAAVGLAAYGWIEVLGHPRRPVPRMSAHLGRSYPGPDRTAALAEAGLERFARHARAANVADLLGAGKFVCWFTGRSEWGPRALGARSILADPTRADSVSTLNSRIKFREPFRPFGISVAEESAATLMDLAATPASLAPYMLCVAPVRDPRLQPICHKDGTLRFHTVAPDEGAYYELLQTMREISGIPAVLNTSFNTAGEPLVETPTDAVRQFIECGADALFIDGVLLCLDDIPVAVVERLRRRSRPSGASALAQALQLEAAGYPEAAARCLPTDAPALEIGPDGLREQCALLMRLALETSDLDSAMRHAENVLAWSGMPASTLQAVEMLQRYAHGPGGLPSQAALFLARLFRQGNSILTMKSLFAERVPDKAERAPGESVGQRS